MDIKMQVNTLKILTQLANTKTDNKAVIESEPQKTEIFDGAKGEPMPRSTPKDEGVSESRIKEYISELGKSKYVKAHNVIIAKNGKIIAEKAFKPYSNECWHITYSMCKTITGMAIGMLVDDGLLKVEDYVCDIFKDKLPLLTNMRLKKLTVKNLLTMSSGVNFNEAGSVTDEDWFEGFFTSGVKFQPGKEFNYNSMNSYILSAIVKEKTGKGLTEFLKARLFEPLGMGKLFWEKSLQGIEKGGWGLYILPEDMCKLGQLILNKGKWGDKTILSEAWIENSTTKQIEVPESIGHYDYGYQLWVGSEPRCVLFNGMFGQNISVFPDIDTVVVVTAGNNDMFQTNEYFKITDKYIGRGFNAPIEKEKMAELDKYIEKSCAKTLKAAENEKELPQICKLLSGQFYMYDKREAASVGLLPLMLQSLQNNYSGGLSVMTFRIEDGVFEMRIQEGDKLYTIPIGFNKTHYYVQDFNGEKYYIGVDGRVDKNEDGYPVLIIKMSFIETASVRLIKLTLRNSNTIVTQWSETPGLDFLINGALSVYEGIDNKFVRKVADTFDVDKVLSRLTNIFSPTITATRIEETNEIILLGMTVDEQKSIVKKLTKRII